MLHEPFTRIRSAFRAKFSARKKKQSKQLERKTPKHLEKPHTEPLKFNRILPVIIGFLQHFNIRRLGALDFVGLDTLVAVSCLRRLNERPFFVTKKKRSELKGVSRLYKAEEYINRRHNFTLCHSYLTHLRL